MRKNIIVFGILLMLILPVVFAQTESLTVGRDNRLRFGHVLYVKNITISPELSPGSASVLKITLGNSGQDFIKDLRARLDLPAQIAPLKDVAQKKISQMDAGQEVDLSFDLVALPDAKAGIYKASLILDYVNFIGDERQDNETISFVITSNPKLFTGIKESTIYKDASELGEVTFEIVNEDVADIKFLSIELADSPDYEIISNNRFYIGDLDSGDTTTSTFKIKVLPNKDKITFPLKLMYKDTLNKDYSSQENLVLDLKTKKELGFVDGNSWVFTLIFILAIVAAIYLSYRHGKRKRRKIDETI